MEKAQFGFDFDGEVNFQVKYNVEPGMGYNSNGQVMADGTRFDDVIDLRAGKKSSDSGFGGFNDFNDGMDIWDSGFQDAMDANMSMATGAAGFDIWNWSPGKGDSPVSNGSGITSLISAYQGGQPVNGKFDIYKVNTATPESPNYIFLAYDTEENSVKEEVKEESAGWKIKLEGVTDSTNISVLNAAQADDWKAWQPSSSDQPKAQGKTITYDDGFTTQDTFDIYEFKTGEFLAYKVEGQFGYVVDLVVLNADGETWNNKRPDDQFKFKRRSKRP